MAYSRAENHNFAKVYKSQGGNKLHCFPTMSLICTLVARTHTSSSSSPRKFITSRVHAANTHTHTALIAQQRAPITNERTDAPHNEHINLLDHHQGG
jgi:hypothetical protein